LCALGCFVCTRRYISVASYQYSQDYLMDHELLCRQWLHLSQELEGYRTKWDERKWNKFPIKYLSHSYFWFIVCLIQQRCFQEPWGAPVENAAGGATLVSTSFSATISLSCPFPCSYQWLPSPASVFFISMFPPTILLSSDVGQKWKLVANAQRVSSQSLVFIPIYYHNTIHKTVSN